MESPPSGRLLDSRIFLEDPPSGRSRSSCSSGCWVVRLELGGTLVLRNISSGCLAPRFVGAASSGEDALPQSWNGAFLPVTQLTVA